MHLGNGGTLDNFFPSQCVPADICSECDPETEFCIDYDIFCNEADAQEAKDSMGFNNCTKHIITGQPVGGSVVYYLSACCPNTFP
jgi:hypothetical protein